jgi:hypothetical protein
MPGAWELVVRSAVNDGVLFRRHLTVEPARTTRVELSE